MPKRDDFDSLTLNILDQIATLLKLTQDLRSMQKTFENSPDLSRKEGKPHADMVTHFAAETATMLLQATFTRDKERLEAICNAQAEVAIKIRGALEAAKTLSQLEQDALQLAGAKGDYIATCVVIPLQQLHDSWTSQQRA